MGRLGEARARRFGVRSRPGDDVVSQLALLGLRPDDVTHVANSHFHFDHCGGNEFFPRSTFLVQRRELEAARDPAVLAEKRYAPSAPDFDHPLAYRPVDGEHDVFGDGTVVLIPTHGHTPGHQSLRVRAGKGGGPGAGRRRLLHAGEHGPGPPPGSALGSRTRWPAPSRACETLRDRQGATIIFGHDPAQWRGAAPRAGAARGWLTWPARAGPGDDGRSSGRSALAVVGLAASRWGAKALARRAPAPTPRDLWVAGLPALLLAWLVPFVSLLNASGTAEGPPRKAFMVASAAAILGVLGSDWLINREERRRLGGAAARELAPRRRRPRAGVAGRPVPRRPPGPLIRRRRRGYRAAGRAAPDAQQSAAQASARGPRRSEGAPLAAGHALLDELADHPHEGRVGPRRPGAHEAEAERGGALAGLGIEVVDDLHVVGHEADGRHDHVGDPLGPEGVEVIEDVRLEPRLLRRAAPALVDERPGLVRHRRRHQGARLAELRDVVGARRHRRPGCCAR